MAIETANNDWRQGQVISQKDSVRLFPNLPLTHHAVVISHDCDLARNSEIEPKIEIIFGPTIDKADGNFTHAKNARKLHLDFSAGNSKSTLELHATEKAEVLKSKLIRCTPSKELLLDQKSKTILMEWLAARYRRSAFPDEFNRRLGEAKVPAKISKKLEPFGSDLMGVYFGLETDREIENDDETYRLEVYILYEDDGSEDKNKRVESLTDQVREIFENAYRDPNSSEWKKIELQDCTWITDHTFTINMAARLQKWNDADYLSLRADPQQAIV